jgi:hypothetical protein
MGQFLGQGHALCCLKQHQEKITPNGDPVALSSQGTTENIGNHKRRLRGVNHFSDGSIAAVEAEIDITAGTLIGALYEWA